MPKQVRIVVAIVCCAMLLSSSVAQSGQWITFGHDPQRSGWASEERAFSWENVSGLGLLWKTVVPNEARALNGLTAPLMVRDVATASGRRDLVIVGGSSDQVFALDAQDGQLVWQTEVAGVEKAPPPTWLIPSALSATPVIDPVHARVFVIASDGHLHTLALADGQALMSPAYFVPPFSKMWSLNYSNGVLYTSIAEANKNMRSGIVAIDPDAPGRPVVTFFSTGGCVKLGCGAGIWGRGGPSADFSGFVYGTTGDGPFDPAANLFGSTILKLNPQNLRLAGYYVAPNWKYLREKDLDMGSSTAVIFRWRNRVLAATGGKEGAIYVVDTGIMPGANHPAAYVSPRYTNQEQLWEKRGIWGGMSVWKDAQEKVWLYVPSWGKPTVEAQFPSTNGPAKDGSIMAFQVVAGASEKPVLKPIWISGNIAVPEPVAIAGGVVFALGTGDDPSQSLNGTFPGLISDREQRNVEHAVLHALDARTGRELWSSGDTITGWTHFSGLAIGGGKVFVTTHDGAVYAFGLRKAGTPAALTTMVPKTTRSQLAPALPGNLSQCGEAGQQYHDDCSSCHGKSGKGTPNHTPDFTDSAWQKKKTNAELVDAVTNGKSGSMPSYGVFLNADQIQALVRCVVRGFGSPASNGPTK